MKPDNEWDTWAADFRHAPAATTHPDVATICARATRDSLLLYLKTGYELAALAGSTVLLAVLSAKVRSLWPFASVVSVINVFLAWQTLRARSGTFRSLGSHVAAFVELAVRRKRADVKLVEVGRIVYAVLVLAFAAWLPFHIATMPDPLAGTWLAVPTRMAFAIVSLSAVAYYLNYSVRRERAKLARLLEVQSSLQSSPEEAAERQPPVPL
ncbi:MAG: hypothetical protein U0271_41050 [Polyangiaceae bacterium]